MVSKKRARKGYALGRYFSLSAFAATSAVVAVVRLELRSVHTVSVKMNEMGSSAYVTTHDQRRRTALLYLHIFLSLYDVLRPPPPPALDQYTSSTFTACAFLCCRSSFITYIYVLSTTNVCSYYQFRSNSSRTHSITFA